MYAGQCQTATEALLGATTADEESGSSAPTGTRELVKDRRKTATDFTRSKASQEQEQPDELGPSAHS